MLREGSIMKVVKLVLSSDIDKHTLAVLRYLPCQVQAALVFPIPTRHPELSQALKTQLSDTASVTVKTNGIFSPSLLHSFILIT